MVNFIWGLSVLLLGFNMKKVYKIEYNCDDAEEQAKEIIKKKICDESFVVNHYIGILEKIKKSIRHRIGCYTNAEIEISKGVSGAVDRLDVIKELNLVIGDINNRIESLERKSKLA